MHSSNSIEQVDLKGSSYCKDCNNLLTKYFKVKNNNNTN